MLAPFAPFISEEVWEKIDNSSTSIIFAGWPSADEDKIDIVAEESEALIMNLIFDLQKICQSHEDYSKKNNFLYCSTLEIKSI